MKWSVGVQLQWRSGPKEEAWGWHRKNGDTHRDVLITHTLCLPKRGLLLFIFLITKPLCTARHVKHGFDVINSQELSRLYCSVSQTVYSPSPSMSREQRLVTGHQFYTQITIPPGRLGRKQLAPEANRQLSLFMLAKIFWLAILCGHKEPDIES